MPVTYRGYGSKPSKLEIVIIGKRYKAIPDNHTFEINLIETLKMHLV